MPSQLRMIASASSSPSSARRDERLAEVRLAERVVALVRGEQARRRRAPCGGRPAAASTRQRERRGEPEPALRVVAARPPELGQRPGEPDARTSRRPAPSPSPAPRGCRRAPRPAGRGPRSRASVGKLRARPPRPRRAPRRRGPSASRRASPLRASRSSASARTVVSIAYAAGRPCVPQERRGRQLAQAVARRSMPERGEAPPLAALEDRGRRRRRERPRRSPPTRRYRRRTGSGSRPMLQSIAARRLRCARPGPPASDASTLARRRARPIRPGELVEELVRREDPQRRRGELDRQRDAVEPAADRRRRGRRWPGSPRAPGGLTRGPRRGTAATAGLRDELVAVVGSPSRAARAAARATRRARAARRARARLVARIVRPGVRACRSASAGAAARTCSTVSRTSSVGAPPERVRSDSTSGRGPARRRRPIAPAIAGSTSEASLTPSSGTNCDPPVATHRASDAASSAASRLLPTPPTPASVTNASGSRPVTEARAIAARSASRPTSGASGARRSAPRPRHGRVGRRARDRVWLVVGRGYAAPGRGRSRTTASASAVGCVEGPSIRREPEPHVAGEDAAVAQPGHRPEASAARR